MNTIAIIGFILGVIGLIATIAGTYISYVTYINPIVRFKKYLKKPQGWEKFQGVENHLSLYRYKKYPTFQIAIDWDKELVKGFHEEWINDNLYPDKTNNSSYQVQLQANGMLLDTELFVSLDGHRYFVPVPQCFSIVDGQREFYYDTQQIQLANIIGRHHFDKNIYDFAKECKGPILIKDEI